MIQCFLLTPVGKERVWLRSYRSGSSCPLPHGYHDARIHYQDIVEGLNLARPDNSKWPTKCACGYEFTEQDTYQLLSQDLYSIAGSDKLVTLQEAPVGAMWYCPWLVDRYEQGLRELPAPGETNSGVLSKFYFEDWYGKRPPLCIKCPDGKDWMPDAPANNGPGWKVTGDVPNITCSPSIDTGTYHGWLNNGVFSNSI